MHVSAEYQRRYSNLLWVRFIILVVLLFAAVAWFCLSASSSAEPTVSPSDQLMPWWLWSLLAVALTGPIFLALDRHKGLPATVILRNAYAFMAVIWVCMALRATIAQNRTDVSYTVLAGALSLTICGISHFLGQRRKN